MEDRERNKLDKYERQAAYMQENAADYPDASRGGAVAALFAAEIANAKALAAAHVGGTGGRAQQISIKADLLDDLKRLMRRLDSAADVVADDFPGIEHLFGLPRNRNEHSIMTAARAQYDESATYEAALVEGDMPAGFRAAMHDLITEIDAANNAADVAGEHGAGSTSAFKASLEKLGKYSRTLEAVNHNKLDANPQKMGAWLAASHLEREPKKKDDGKGGGTTGGGVHNP